MKSNNINPPDKYGWTPMDDALRKGNFKKVKELLDLGVDANGKNKNGESYLFYCAEKEVDLLYDDNGVLCVVETDDTKIAGILLEHGADVNAVHDHHMETPLIAAASRRKIEMVKLFMEHGADVSYGYPVLAASYGEPDYNILEYLLEHGAAVNPENEKETSAIAIVASWWNGRLEIVKLLHKYGAYIDGVDYNGQTAFFNACFWGDMKVIKYLHEQGANIHTLYKGKTALMEAASGRRDSGLDSEVIDYLIKNGINVNAVTKSGVTALMECAKKGNLDFVQPLLKHSANINAVTKKGESALFFAIKGKHKDVEKLLLEQGADNSLACIEEIRSKNKKDKFDYLSAMYADTYFPEFLVNKVKTLIVKVVEFLDKGEYTTEEVQAKFDTMTRGINKLQEKFEENDSEIETGARESIGETIQEIIDYYKLPLDVETAIRERDW